METSFIKDNLDSLKDIIDGSVVVGNVIELSPLVKVVPIYKVKISYLLVQTDLKQNSGNGSNGNISLTPICLLQLNDGDVKVLSLRGSDKLDFIDRVPDLISSISSNVDIASIFKNIKI